MTLFKRKKWYFKEYLMNITTEEEIHIFYAENLTKELAKTMMTSGIVIPEGFVLITERGRT
jgi:hypothetical protein